MSKVCSLFDSSAHLCLLEEHVGEIGHREVVYLSSDADAGRFVMSVGGWTIGSGIGRWAGDAW